MFNSGNCMFCAGTVRSIFWWIYAVFYVLAQDPVVIIPQGRIAGTKVYSENSLLPIEIFFGIPYANPPIGRYRFAAPERHTGWRKTFLAHRIRPRCPQASDENTGEHYNEDCLYLNIWTSRRADGKLMPVVMILYSETWDRGGVTLPCEELSAEGLVVVTVAYRLSLLAYFTLQSLSARGNLALLDQYLAMLWVRDNIAAFGGDPSAITLIGHSAGADSILHHMTSPRSVGLFQRVILMAPRYVWKAVDEGRSTNVTEMEILSRKIARSFGCGSELDQEILHCLRDKPLSDIMIMYSRYNWSESFQPVPDDFLPKSEQYLPIPLAAALSSAKQHNLQIDLLLGATDLENINHRDDRYMELLKQTPSYITEYANVKIIPEVLKMFLIYQSNSLPVLSQAIHWEYWRVKSNKNKSIEAVEGLARMESSAKWSVGNALLAARLARRVNRLYVYRYLQPSQTDLRGYQLNFTGAVHGSDLIALLGDAFTLQIARRPATQEQKRISMLFRQYIVNFIKHGSPAEETVWQRYKIGDAYVHGIINDEITLHSFQNVNRDASFWLQYLPQLYSILSSTKPTATEQKTSQEGEDRLRGGVFAMCGVSAGLLLLLTLSIIFLHKTRTRRNSIDIHI